MKVYAISDLHLGSGVGKTMDIFGSVWEGHGEAIARNWRETVDPADLVLMPGDLSWAMQREEAVPDLELIRSLPGHKVLVRGNHDCWINSPGKVRQMLGQDMELIRFDACVYGGIGLCGVRGWPWPGYVEFEEGRDRRRYRREMARLSLSLEHLAGLEWNTACALMHYPPIADGRRSEFCRLFSDAGITWVVYGHIHGPFEAGAVPAEVIDGVHYVCVSADLLGFRPALLFDADASA